MLNDDVFFPEMTLSSFPRKVYFQISLAGYHDNGQDFFPKMAISSFHKPIFRFYLDFFPRMTGSSFPRFWNFFSKIHRKWLMVDSKRKSKFDSKKSPKFDSEKKFDSKNNF